MIPTGRSWSGWGMAAEAQELSPELRSMLRAGLGIKRERPAVEPAEIRLPVTRLAAEDRSELEAVVGAANVHEDRRARLEHTRGKSTPDLLRMRAGDAAEAPDAVVAPGSHEEVLDLLQVCSARRLAVVPFGGGTSVVGGLAPAPERLRAVVALALARMDRLLELDELSRTAVLEPGLNGMEAEHALAERGYTLGHRPQSLQFASVGGFAATRSAGEASAGYGRFDELVVGLRVATPRGTIELGRAPKSAAGPDLRQLFLGSEGALGVITGVRVEIRPAPAARLYEGWRLPSFADGLTVLRLLAQDGPRPTSLRLSDEVETALDLGRAAAPAEPAASLEAAPDRNGAGGCMAIVGFEGSQAGVAERCERVAAMMRGAGAQRDRTAGEAWLRGRYKAPYLRDALLDAGALVETLETATFWSGLEHLYGSVREALVQSLTELGTPPVVLCHVSHVYRSGASLYFTVAAAQLDDPLAQWASAKRAASDTILAAGGSITHHHGVGRDHREHYARETGRLAIEVLRAAKTTLDPAGILNPGVLIA